MGCVVIDGINKKMTMMGIADEDDEEMPDELAVIYKMSFYQSPRHTKSHTDTYYAEERDTRWGHRTVWEDGTICKIYVILVLKESKEYRMAINNSSKV
jgi:hypothetical protein